MNAAQLLKHYELIADAPDAVARLRHLVLSLAVRGKLCRADAKHSSTRIAKIVGGHDPASVPFSIPATWSWRQLRELGRIKGGGTPSKSRDDFWNGSIPWVSPKDMKVEYIKTAQLKITDAAIDGSAANLITPRSILFVVRGMILAHSFPVAVTTTPVAINQDMKAIELREPEHAEYLLRALRGMKPQMLARVQRSSHGTCRLEGNDYADFLVPIPPLAEQRRIVAKVDELMALCDRLETARNEREANRDRMSSATLTRLNPPDADAKVFAGHARFALDNLDALTTRPDQIKQLRQTILNLAVRGKLVPQNPNDEPASELLKRAAKAQRIAIENEGLRSRPPIEKVARGDMWFEFPDSWAHAAFDDVFVMVSGVTKGQKIAASEAIDVPYLRVANVQRGHLDLAVIKTIAVRKSDQVRYQLKPGDVLMTEGGDWDKLGRAAIWSSEIDGCIHQNHVFRVRSPSNDIMPEWVITYANSLLGRAFFEDASKQTTNLASINMTQLRGCPLPLPPLAEQRRIIAKVDQLTALCDGLEANLTGSATTRRRLLDALLAEALAPTDAAQREAAE